MEGQNSQEEKRKMRYDKELNQLKIKEAFLELIAELNRRPTVAELCERSGLSDKVVRNALKTIRFDAVKNPLRILTDEVLIKVYQKAVGIEQEQVRMQLNSITGELEVIPYTVTLPPDVPAAKLWLQVVEGWTEKQEHKHTGEVKVTTPPVTLKITRGSKVERDQNPNSQLSSFNEGPKAE